MRSQELCECTVVLNELVVSAALRDSIVVHHDDVIRMFQVLDLISYKETRLKVNEYEYNASFIYEKTYSSSTC